VQVAGGGYDVAWHDPSSGLYTIWSISNSGAYQSNLIGQVAGNNVSLENFETLFNQDLNGDGHVGPPPPTVIHDNGTTSLVQSGSNYFLDADGVSGLGPELALNGSAVTAGELGTWAPISAVQVAGGGYDVAWHDPSSGLYTIWSISSSGAYQSNLIGAVAGNNVSLENFETLFNQDLNGDGTIGVPPTTQPSASTSNSAAASLQSTPASSPASTAPAESVTLSNGTMVADNFVFAPNFGQATVANFNTVSDTLRIDHTMFATVSALLATTHDDASGNAVIVDAQHDSITVKGVSTAQLLAHQNDFHIV